MSEIWSHPGFQAGVVPGFVSLILFFAFTRIRVLLGFAIVVAFLATVGLTTGYSIDPLTSTRKIFLLVIIASLLGLVFETRIIPKKLSGAIASVFGAAALLWVVWPFITREDVLYGWAIGLALAAFAAWVVFWFMRLADQSALNGAAVLASAGMATGISALLGASALLGQWGIAFGSAGLSAIIISLISKRMGASGNVFVLSSGVGIALFAGAAFVYAKLPWYVLLVLAVIPALGQIRTNGATSRTNQFLVVMSVTAVVAFAAILLTWKSEGGIPL